MSKCPSFQERVRARMTHTFGLTIPNDIRERNHRFLEEALEMVQAGGCSQSEAIQLVDYVFNRPVGEIKQEIGGVMVTLAAFCQAHSIGMVDAGNAELYRCWKKADAIRAKQAAKPRHSPLPQ